MTTTVTHRSRFGAIHAIGPQTQKRYADVLKAVERPGIGDSIINLRSSAFRVFFYGLTGDPEFLTAQSPTYYNGPHLDGDRFILTDTDSDDRSRFSQSVSPGPDTVAEIRERFINGLSKTYTYP